MLNFDRSRPVYISTFTFSFALSLNLAKEGTSVKIIAKVTGLSEADIKQILLKLSC